AMIAFSYFHHPKVYVRLHELAHEPGHPAWRACLTRLYTVGNEFTLEHLGRIDKTKLPVGDADHLAKTLTALEQWVNEPSRSKKVYPAPWLANVRWAEQAKSPLAAALTRWSLTFLSHHEDRFNADLAKVRDNYQVIYNVPDEVAFRARVRGLANEILAARQPK